MEINKTILMLFTFILLLFVNLKCAAIKLIDKTDDSQYVFGSSVELMCKFETIVSDVSLEWKLNGKPVIMIDKVVYPYELNPKIKVLVVKNLNPEREGNYSCIGSNSEGSAQGDIMVSIYKEKPTITSLLPDVYLFAGNSYSIACVAKGYPFPKMEWSKQGGILDTNFDDHQNGTLQIQSFTSGNEGTYTCSAENNMGIATASFKVNLVSVAGWLKKPVNHTNVKAGEQLELSLTYISSFAVKFRWLKDSNILSSDSIRTVSAGAAYTSTLYVPEVSVGNAGLYKVQVDGTITSGVQYDFLVTVWAKPFVNIAEGTTVVVREGGTALIYCMIHAYPPPQVTWQRNGTIIDSATANQTQSTTGQRTVRTLRINNVVKDDEGLFTCFASNNQGNSSGSINLIVEVPGSEKDDNTTIIIVVSVISAVIIILIVVLVVLYIKFKDKWFGKYSDSGTFYTDLVQEEKDMSSPADLEKNPYSIKKNINISIKQSTRGGSNTAPRTFSQNGKGGSMKQSTINFRNRSLKMSVKSPTSPVTENHYAPLDSLVSQGKAIDFKRIIFDEMLGTGEYGLVNGGRLIDDDDPSIYKEISIKMLKDNYTAQERRDILAELRMMRRISKHPNIISLIGWCITDDNVYVVEEHMPFGSLLTFLRAHRSIDADEMQELPLEDRVDSKTLISFAWQIAAGMKHLASLQIVHRDLACRNVYLGHEKTCKISEYGLSRDIYSENVFRKTTGGQLPVRWMAYEAVFNGEYTTKSDVWAFGILLWELITLGKIPYPGIVRTEQLLDELESGYHMENPGHISTDIYLLMSECWNRDPEERPSFEQLQMKMGAFLKDEQEVHIDLDKLHSLEHALEDDENEADAGPTNNVHKPSAFQNIKEEEEEEGNPGYEEIGVNGNAVVS